jgi:hypothetical protein
MDEETGGWTKVDNKELLDVNDHFDRIRLRL